EVVFPELIDRHAPGQRMVGADEPPCKSQPPAGLFCTGPGWLNLERRPAVGQDGRHPRADQPAGTERIAAAVEVRGRSLSPIPEGLDFGFRRPAPFQRLYPPLRLFKLLLEGGVQRL